MQGELDVLRNQVTRLRSEMWQAKSQNTDLAKKGEEMQKEGTALLTQVQGLNKERDAFASQVAQRGITIETNAKSWRELLAKVDVVEKDVKEKDK